MQHIKHIPMDGPKNFRDIGGYMNGEGRLVAWNRLYRSDGLSALSERDEALFRALDIRTIVDLRGSAERDMLPDSIPEGVEYFHCPMMREAGADKASALSDFARSLVVGYKSMVTDDAALAGAAVNAVIDGLEKGAVVFHCSAGKDRTGVLAAILLLLLGVGEEDIIADYQVSHTYNEKGINAVIVRSPEIAQRFSLPGGDSMLRSEPENIKAVLDELNAQNISARMEQAGVSPSSQQRLRDHMLISL